MSEIDDGPPLRVGEHFYLGDRYTDPELLDPRLRALYEGGASDD